MSSTTHNLIIPVPKWTLSALLSFLIVVAAGGCSTGRNGGPAEDEPGPPQTPEAEALKTYNALRQEILEGNFIALYDYCSEEYRKKKFASEDFRKNIASLPDLKAHDLTAEQVARMRPRELVEIYFRILLPETHKKHIVQGMAGVVIIGKKRLPDGRVEIRIDSGGSRSRLIWAREGKEWKMDGQENLPPPGDSRDPESRSR